MLKLQLQKDTRKMQDASTLLILEHLTFQSKKENDS